MKKLTKQAVAYTLSMIIATAMVIATPFLPGSILAQAEGTMDINEFSIPAPYTALRNITKGPDGNLWFTEFGGYQNGIGKITPNGTITEYPLADNSQPWGITSGPDGNIWFTEHFANKIGKITPNGVFTEYPITTGNYYTSRGITSGPDGNLWFTDINKICKITPNGTITEYPLADNAFINEWGDITSGPDGNLWFIERNNYISKLGKITPNGTITEYPITDYYTGTWGGHHFRP